MFDIVSIGAATTDIFIKSNQLTVKADTEVEGGQSLSLAYSSKNEISDSLICSGGGATNSSVSFSRLGLKSACVSLFGTDPLSHYILQDLESNDVDSSLLVQSDQEKTDFSVILVAPDGGRSILTSRGPSCLQEDHLNWSTLMQSGWLYISSLEGNLDLLEKIIGFGFENNIRISLNPGNRELSDPSRLIPLLSHVDFLLLNRTESQQLTQHSIDDDLFWKKLASFGSKITAITDGRHGAYVLFETQKLFSPIINVHPVDETGAGDGFGSAFVAALAHQLTPNDALHWGIKNSASVVSRLGAKPGLLTLDQMKS